MESRSTRKTGQEQTARDKQAAETAPLAADGLSADYSQISCLVLFPRLRHRSFRPLRLEIGRRPSPPPGRRRCERVAIWRPRLLGVTLHRRPSAAGVVPLCWRRRRQRGRCTFITPPERLVGRRFAAALPSPRLRHLQPRWGDLRRAGVRAPPRCDRDQCGLLSRSHRCGGAEGGPAPELPRVGRDRRLAAARASSRLRCHLDGVWPVHNTSMTRP